MTPASDSQAGRLAGRSDPLAASDRHGRSAEQPGAGRSVRGPDGADGAVELEQCDGVHRWPWGLKRCPQPVPAHLEREVCDYCDSKVNLLTIHDVEGFDD